MFEYHGWVTVVQSLDDEEDEVANDETIYAIRSRFAAWRQSGIATLQPVNGRYQVWVSGYLNRSEGAKATLVDLFKCIGAMAHGSYGLLYMRDDADPPGPYNEFQVYVLARGSLLERRDPFLSPCAPTIEDAIDILS